MVEKPEVEQDDVTAVQPDTEKVVEEVAELKAPAPVTNKDKAENRPVRASNELTDDAALWTPVIDQLKAFGDTTVSPPCITLRTRIKASEHIYPAHFIKEMIEPGSFFGQKTGMVKIALPVLDVDFPVCNIDITA